jgi:transposase
MGRPLSMDLRERMMAAFATGLSRRAVAQRFKVAVSSMIKLVQHQQRTGSLAPKPPWRRKPYALAVHEDLVRGLVRAQPDMTLDELHEALAAEQVFVSRSAVDRFLKSLDLTLKKSHSGLPSRNVRTSPTHDTPGPRARSSLTRRSSSSSTKPG